MTDPDRMRFVRGGGCLMLFGLPFLAAGLFVMFSPLLGVEMKDAQTGQPASLGFLIPFGSVFAAVGASLMFGRSVVEIDRRQGHILSWWGVLVPFKKTFRRLEEFEHVTITSEVRSSKNSTYTVYPVSLGTSRGGLEAVSLREFRDPERCRGEAEKVAKFLNMGVSDETVSPASFREAGTLDISLREQLRDAPPAEPKPPHPAQATYVREGRTACSVEIPAEGFTPVHTIIALLALVIPLGFVGVFLSDVLSDVFAGNEPWHAGHFVMLAFGALIVLVGGLGPMLSLTKRATTRERLTINPDAVSLKQTWKLGTREQSIPMEELEEVEIADRSAGRPSPFGSNRSVRLRSDRLGLDVGRALGPQEQAWLCDLIRYVAATGTCPER